MLVLYPYKNALWALRPAKPLGVLSRHPCRNPKPLPRGEGLCMLCWLCIVQSLWAYTPGIRAGAECGAAALTPLGATPKARTLWLLAKSFARCKTSRASNTRHPIFDKQEVYRQTESCGSFIAATAFIFTLSATEVYRVPHRISGNALLHVHAGILSHCLRPDRRRL